MSRSVVDRGSADTEQPAGADAVRPPVRHPRRGWAAPFALVAGLVTVFAMALLPFAPVHMSQPVVSWPQSATSPQSTMLQLTAQTPLSIDVRFSCAAARVAGGTTDGVLFATVRPGQPSAGGQGLLASVTDGRLDVRADDQTLVDGADVAGDCSYRVAGDGTGLTVTRDGDVVGRTGAGDLPQVDVLATSVGSLDPAQGEQLSARVTVDDQFSTPPSPLKWALIVIVLLGAAASAAFVVAEHRARSGPRPAPGRRAGRRFSVADVVVPLVMVSWVFLAPMSDDDGYYAAMARDSLHQGAVGNYYQLLNQNFTPFTWFYRVLGHWQQVGDSPVLLRIPALVTGLLTWWALRRFTTQPGALPGVLTRSRRGRASLTLVLGLAVLAWWLPYGMGVRPEAAVGFLAVATLLAVSSGIRRASLPLLMVAVVTAAMSVVAHPTGFVALGPLLAGLPRMIGVVRQGVPAARAWIRGLAVVAPGAVAGVAAMGDGSLNDFFRGQQIFLSIQAQNDWYDEYQRWNFLFSPIAMGSYAKRTAVVLAVVCLVWFGLLAAASRRRTVISPQLLLAAQSLTIAFALLWLTPSKWTHHFGALDGLGPAFLTLFVVSLPVLVRALPGGLRSWLVAVPAVGSAVVAFSLAMHGPNDWAYSWLQGVPHPFQAPSVSVLHFDSPLLWLLGTLVVIGLVRLLHRRAGLPRRRPWLTALPFVTVVFLGLSVAYLLGGFAFAAVRTADTYSPWADAFQDPTGKTCGPAKDIDVLDVDGGQPLVPVAGTGSATGVFTAGGGYYPASPPPTAPGTGAVAQEWGSLQGDADGSATGTFTSPWYPLPSDLAPDQRLAFLVSGKLDEDGNTVTVEYGRGTGADAAVVGSADVSDGTQSAVWRTHTIDAGAARAAGADAVRIVAQDGTASSPGWLAVTGPSVVRTERLSEYLPADAAVATAWQFSFLFPCQRQLTIDDGITEPMQYAVMWGQGGVNGLGDATWQLGRGGLFAPTLRDSSVTEVGGAFPDWPGIDTVQVFKVVAPYATAAYDLDQEQVDRWGWQGPVEARWPYGD